MTTLTVKLAWTRSEGRYVCRVAAHTYEVRRSPGYPAYPLPVWEAFRDGVNIGGSRTLAAAKEVAVRAAIRDAINA